jgi:nucleoside-diphosphate-sugar epimerase
VKHVAFVGGATGYTGREVVKSLVDAGVRAIAHVRPDTARLVYWQTHFADVGAEVDTTPWEPEAMKATFARVSPTLVFALLGTTRSRAREEEKATGSRSSYDTVDYGLTAQLMGAAETMKDKPRFIYLSSAGMPVKEPGRESYMHARWQVEKELKASSLPYTIARPSIITGSDRDESRTGERVAAVVADGVLAAVGLFGGKGLRARWSSTTNVALADALVRIALDPACACAIVESERLR